MGLYDKSRGFLTSFGTRLMVVMAKDKEDENMQFLWIC